MEEAAREFDARMVRLCLNGDRDAFAQLVERYQSEILRYCISQTLNASTAEELAQEAFLRAYQRLSQLKSPDRFQPWLYRIAGNVAHSYRRKLREEPMDPATHVHISAGEIEQYGTDRRRDMQELAENALRLIPANIRACVVLRVCEDMSYRDIAERLHIAPAAAESRVRRALQTMREYISGIGREDEVRDVLRYGIAGTLIGPDIVSAVMQRVAGLPDPRDTDTPDRDLRTSAAFSLAIVSAVFVGVGAMSTGTRGSDAPTTGRQAAATSVTPLSAISFGDYVGPIGTPALTDAPSGALYDFESGDITGWSGRHYNRRLDRYHTVPDAALHVQKLVLDNPAIPNSRGLRFQKEDKGPYLLSSLTSPSFGPFTEPFVAEWDVLLGDDNYGMYLAEASPDAANSESEVKLAGIYFSGDTLTAMAAGYPRIGHYQPDTLFHVRVEMDPQTATFRLQIDGKSSDLTGSPRSHVATDKLPFAGTYSGTGFRHIVFVMGQAASRQYYDSQMILDNVKIEPVAQTPDIVARATLAHLP